MHHKTSQIYPFLPQKEVMQYFDTTSTDVCMTPSDDRCVGTLSCKLRVLVA